MTSSLRRITAAHVTLACGLVALVVTGHTPLAQTQGPTPPRQPIDQEYTARIKEYTRDPRISTELVDHLPASDTIPSPLKFLGRMPGTPGELTYAADIHRYLDAIDRASDRISTWKIGRTEEGRDIMLLAVADEATIRSLSKYKAMVTALTDPRTTSAAEAERLIASAKPIYWITSGMHSTETGGPEMLMELAYRLAVEETPFIRAIRDNVITLITPVVEVDGREKQVDTYYYNKKRQQEGHTQALPLMYWGRYVAHDNNRDGIGQFLALTKAITRTFLDWRPTVLHDLHEAQTYLYTSTGTGPYNDALDAITIDEWWVLAKTEVMEMTKRGVPGVWTYGFYDGWAPNYMFFIANSHNAIGRFYEVASYGPDPREWRAGPPLTSREWFRPNPPLPLIKWGPRNNTNIQQSALLIALNHVAKNKTTYLENYWVKNKRAVDRGRHGPIYGWLIPAAQRRQAEAAGAVNDLRRQGLEVRRADAEWDAGDVHIRRGDYVIPGDQPYRTLAEMYFSVQNYSPANPRAYDDTGWTFQYLRNLVLKPLTNKAALQAPSTMITADVVAPGGILGRGPVLILDHTTDNNLIRVRMRHRDVAMAAAEDSFEVDGRRFRAGSFIIKTTEVTALSKTLEELGVMAWATQSVPSVATHDLDVPRIGLIHSWARPQDEGWVRAAFDTFEVPYDYLADITLRDGNLRQKYDVLVFPHIGGSAVSQVNGIARTDTAPLPYKRTPDTRHLGVQDEADDIRGGIGLEGLHELAAFVRQGGTLITEGSTSTIFPEYKLTPGVVVENPQGLFVRGSVMRGVVVDARSPIAYGYDEQVPVYFNQEPVLSAATGGVGAPAVPLPGLGMNITPMASSSQRLSRWDPEASAFGIVTRTPEQAPASSGGNGRAGGVSSPPSGGAAEGQPRVILRFPSNPDDLLLSGVLVGAEALVNRAQLIDVPLGKGHLVMFAIRPYWRWQTHATYFLGFNAILNWNDLDSGRGRGATAVNVPDLSSAQLRIQWADFKKLYDDKAIVVVDVRGQEAYSAGHIHGARWVPLAEVEGKAHELKQLQKPIVLYCS